jgi:hypothetical protein
VAAALAAIAEILAVQVALVKADTVAVITTAGNH